MRWHPSTIPTGPLHEPQELPPHLFPSQPHPSAFLALLGLAALLDDVQHLGEGIGISLPVVLHAHRGGVVIHRVRKVLVARHLQQIAFPASAALLDLDHPHRGRVGAALPQRLPLLILELAQMPLLVDGIDQVAITPHLPVGVVVVDPDDRARREAILRRAAVGLVVPVERGCKSLFNLRDLHAARARPNRIDDHQHRLVLPHPIRKLPHVVELEPADDPEVGVRRIDVVVLQVALQLRQRLVRLDPQHRPLHHVHVDAPHPHRAPA